MSARPDTKLVNSGWAWPRANAHKAHYFDEGRAMCGKWAYFGELYPAATFSAHDRCKGCKRRLS